MTDRYKAFIVVLNKSIREDDAEQIINALNMIKGVVQITPLTENAQDSISYEKGKRDVLRSIEEKITEMFG